VYETTSKTSLKFAYHAARQAAITIVYRLYGER
jgi:hypothetical protein